MPYWLIRTREVAVEVEAPNWLTGVAFALPQLGITDVEFDRLVAEQAGEGIRIWDPKNRMRILAKQIEAPTATDDERFAEDELADLDIELAELPAPPAAVAEALFLNTASISEAATPEAAAAVALDVLSRMVPSESSSVIFCGLNDTSLRFLAARGPKADAIKAFEIPLGEGLAGYVHDTGRALLLHDVHHIAKHLHHLDTFTGYRPRSVLAVPIRDEEGHTWGVLELLDHEDRFLPWHPEAALEVGLALADVLTAQLMPEGV